MAYKGQSLPPEGRLGRQALKALLSSGYMIICLAPLSIRTAHRMPFSFVGVSALCLPTLATKGPFGTTSFAAVT
jgi:hypothetical protein